MQTEFPLQYDVRTLFQWVAERQQEGTVVVPAREVQEALHVASDTNFAAMVDELMNCSYVHFPVIEDVQVEEDSHEDVLILHNYAYIAWLIYLELEKQHLYP